MDHLCEPALLRFTEIPGIKGHDNYWMEAGEKMFRVWDGPVGVEGSEVLEWFTTEKLLWDRNRGIAGIEGLDHVRDLMTYDLLYVGIAMKGDTFDRCSSGATKPAWIFWRTNRSVIPERASPMKYISFPFRIDPLLVQTFDLEHEFTEQDFATELDRKRILADAEKAFVSLLKPQYNIVTFNNYPQGADGLYGSHIDRYGYLIGESIAFNTAHGRIKGARDPWGTISNDADFIFIDGDEVFFYVSGVDFPATAREANAQP
jgi:hypothetical protein